jgi:hypothetical protein
MKKCEVCQKEGARVHFRSKTNMTLCDKHNNQMIKHGKILEQTRFSPNTIKEDGGVAYLGLNNFSGEVVKWAIIDIEDLHKVCDYKWFARTDGRVVANVRSLGVGASHIRLHNVIMDFDDALKYQYEIDHISGDVLDNRKSNLRIVTKSKNIMNRGLQSNNSSGVCGVVSRDNNNTPPWIPQIKVNGVTTRLGTRYSFDEAVSVRLIAESDLFKEYSNNYNHTTQTLQLSYTSLDDNLPTFIEVSLSGEILSQTKTPNPLDNPSHP